MAKYINTSSHIELTDFKTKLNQHIESMNKEGWELLSVIQQTVGIYEYMLMFWKKEVV